MEHWSDDSDRGKPKPSEDQSVIATIFRLLIPLVFYVNMGGWVRQNSTVLGRPADPEKAPSDPTPEPTSDTSGVPSKPSNTKGYSPELSRSPTSLDFSVPSSILT